jgi:hypothetical protein
MDNREESKPFATGDAVLAACLTDRRIFESSDEDIKNALRYVMLLVGIRQKTIMEMEEEEKVMLVMFVRRKYAGNTLAEFKLAFDKAISGELPLKDAKPYENFTCEYIGRIMSAYRAWASSVIQESGMLYRNNEQKSLPPPNYNPLQLPDSYYQDFLSNKLNLDLVFGLAWDIVSKELGVKYEEYELLAIVQQAKDHVLFDLTDRMKKTNADKKFGDYLSAKKQKDLLEKMKAGEACNDSDVNKYAKALALNKWFHKIKEDGVKSLINIKC